MQTSKRGLDLIKAAEGLEHHAYRDAVGVWTIGYGHTLNVTPGAVITTERAVELLQADLRRFEASVTRQVKVPINQHQFDALVSFSFNVGSSALKTSTLLDLLNRYQYADAADQFPRWKYAKGRVMPGLVTRRAAERDLFLTTVEMPLPASWLDAVVTVSNTGCRPDMPDSWLDEVVTTRR